MKAKDAISAYTTVMDELMAEERRNAAIEFGKYLQYKRVDFFGYAYSIETLFDEYQEQKNELRKQHIL